jgi:hypothetical protein
MEETKLAKIEPVSWAERVGATTCSAMCASRRRVAIAARVARLEYTVAAVRTTRRSSRWHATHTRGACVSLERLDSRRDDPRPDRSQPETLQSARGPKLATRGAPALQKTLHSFSGNRSWDWRFAAAAVALL